MMKTVSSLSWRRRQLLGRGSYGAVYLAESCSTDSPLALKTAKAAKSFSLQKEEKILRQFVGCPWVVQCYGGEYSIADGITFYNLILEYASGGSLFDLIKSYGDKRIPEADVRRYTRELLMALTCIHDKGFVHCDLTLGNILAFPCENCNGYHLKISDFGLAKVDEERDEDWKLKFRGTKLYMSPESVEKGKIEAPMDIWSLGCIVIEMITGEKAWKNLREGDNFLVKLALLGESPPIPINLSEERRDFLRKCLDLDSEKRWTADMLLKHPFVAQDCVAPPPVSVSDGIWDVEGLNWNEIYQMADEQERLIRHERRALAWGIYEQGGF